MVGVKPYMVSAKMSFKIPTLAHTIVKHMYKQRKIIYNPVKDCIFAQVLSWLQE